MKNIEIEELKKIQIKILEDVDEFCRQNNINYWLDCGTLIGAIRHKGYIPWDDDIDIGMLRADYDYFMKRYNNNSNYYKAVCIEQDQSYTLAHGKVVDNRTVLYEPDKNGRKMAVNIDVFVYDNAPNDDKKAAKMYRIRNFYRALNVAHTQDKDYMGGTLRKIQFRLLHILTWGFPKNYFAKKMSDNAKRYQKTETTRIGNFTSYDTILCNKDVFKSFVEKEFEGRLYMVPIGYDKWLKLFYGDYMKLPPKEKRVSHHRFEAYYLDDVDSVIKTK